MKALKMSPRSPRSKVKELRKSGFVPCCIYENELVEPILAQIPKKDAQKLLEKHAIESQLEVSLEGKIMSVMIKDFNRDPVEEEIRQIDFQALAITQ